MVHKLPLLQDNQSSQIIRAKRYGANSLKVAIDLGFLYIFIAIWIMQLMTHYSRRLILDIEPHYANTHAIFK